MTKKSITYAMELQISCGVCAEVQKTGILRRKETSNRRDIEEIM